MDILIVARGEPQIDQMVALIRANGMSADGTNDDDDAAARLEAGDVSTLVIGGGVAPASRERLATLADRKGVRVIQGALRGRDPKTYFREELRPALKRS